MKKIIIILIIVSILFLSGCDTVVQYNENDLKALGLEACKLGCSEYPMELIELKETGCINENYVIAVDNCYNFCIDYFEKK